MEGEGLETGGNRKELDYISLSIPHNPGLHPSFYYYYLLVEDLDYGVKKRMLLSSLLSLRGSFPYRNIRFFTLGLLRFPSGPLRGR